MKTIILAGGSGVRLWPLSREKYPKQFIKLGDEKESLFQKTFKRSLLISHIDDIYIITNEKYKFLVMSDIEEIGFTYKEENIVVEPESKNTLPAIYAGISEIIKKGQDSVVVFPSDHMIVKNDEFVKTLKESEKLVKDFIITFGIKPDGPHTGYGYISPGEKKLNGFIVNSFKEKPTREKAEEYINNGYYWNAGIFMFDSHLFSNEVSIYSPEIFQAFLINNNIKDAFSQINTKISIDYGIMEKSNKVAVVPIDIGWNDLGSFDAFYDIFQQNEKGNISDEENIIIDSKNNLIQSYTGKMVAAVGVEDLIIIDNKDALLVCKKDQSQKVKSVVDTLRERNDDRSEYSVENYRSWGHYKSLEEEKDAFKIKKITINAGKKLSYETHYDKSEYWIVIRGIAKITVNSEVKFVQEGECTFFKQAQKYHLENQGKIALEIIEVQID